MRAMSNSPNSAMNALVVQDLLRQKDASIAALQAQLVWLQKQLFGRRSERIVGDADSQTLVLDFGDQGLAKPQEPATEEIRYQRRKPVKNRGADTLSHPEGLPVKRKTSTAKKFDVSSIQSKLIGERKNGPPYREWNSFTLPEPPAAMLYGSTEFIPFILFIPVNLNAFRSAQQRTAEMKMAAA